MGTKRVMAQYGCLCYYKISNHIDIFVYDGHTPNMIDGKTRLELVVEAIVNLLSANGFKYFISHLNDVRDDFHAIIKF